MRELLDDAEQPYELDPTLVRGLDYYTRTVFEFTSDALGAQSGVGGGGRYDGLIEQLGGQPTPASGWAAGVERILLAAPEPPLAPPHVDLFVALATGDAARQAFDLVREARRVGLSAQLELTDGRSGGSSGTQTGSALATLRSSVPSEKSASRRWSRASRSELEPRSVIPTILRGNRLV